VLSYRDMTFCSFYTNCALADECHRPLTPEVIAAAQAWWGGDDVPIAQFFYRPTCWENKEDSGDG
jgi:hypothetical protein